MEEGIENGTEILQVQQLVYVTVSIGYHHYLKLVNLSIHL